MPHTQLYASMMQAHTTLTLISVIPDCILLAGFIAIVIILHTKSKQIIDLLNAQHLTEARTNENNIEINELYKEVVSLKEG